MKKFLSLILAIVMISAINVTTFAAEYPEVKSVETRETNVVVIPEYDEEEGSIGQTFVGVDGTKVSYFDGTIMNPNMRATQTDYNGARFIHDSRWSGNANGNQAQAETEAYKISDSSIGHRNYTRVRVVNAFFPSRIIEDTDRCWAARYSSAKSSRNDSYFETEFAMRSYWGDSTT